MASPNLQLTLNRGPYSLTPLPPQVVSRCAGHLADSPCRRLATHRLLAQGGVVQLLCDEHTVNWAREHGWFVTWGSDTQAVA